MIISDGEIKVDTGNTLTQQNWDAILDSPATPSQEDYMPLDPSYRFTSFDQLEALDDRSIWLILREIPSPLFLEALVKARPDLKEKFFKNMSPAAREILDADMKDLELRNIPEWRAPFGQMSILNSANRLCSEGQLSGLKSFFGDGEDFYALSQEEVNSLLAGVAMESDYGDDLSLTPKLTPPIANIPVVVEVVDAVQGMTLGDITKLQPGTLLGLQPEFQIVVNGEPIGTAVVTSEGVWVSSLYQKRKAKQ